MMINFLSSIGKNILRIFCVLAILVLGHGCAILSDTDEKNFKDKIILLDNIIEELTNLKAENHEVERYYKGNSEVVITKIDVNEKIEILKNRKSEMNDLFNNLEQFTSKENEWKYDTEFCLVYAKLIIATYTRSVSDVALFLKGMAKLRDYGKNVKIHKWTKKNFAKSFWKGSDGIFSKNLSEKENLDVFFRLGNVTLMIYQKNYEQAKRECETVLNIVKNEDFFAKQALVLLNTIEDEKNRGK